MCAGAVVQPRTMLEPHVIVNTGAVVDHDCRVAAFAQIGPGSTLCGGVLLGIGAMVGAGATIVPGVRVGSRAPVRARARRRGGRRCA